MSSNRPTGTREVNRNAIGQLLQKFVDWQDIQFFDPETGAL